jgi:hypothetical protein
MRNCPGLMAYYGDAVLPVESDRLRPLARTLHMKRIKMQGFFVSDYRHRGCAPQQAAKPQRLRTNSNPSVLLGGLDAGRQGRKPKGCECCGER